VGEDGEAEAASERLDEECIKQVQWLVTEQSSKSLRSIAQSWTSDSSIRMSKEKDGILEAGSRHLEPLYRAWVDRGHKMSRCRPNFESKFLEQHFRVARTRVEAWRRGMAAGNACA
jgi:hypothetical protein